MRGKLRKPSSGLTSKVPHCVINIPGYLSWSLICALKREDCLHKLCLKIKHMPVRLSHINYR